jgi:hypothetical protein
MQPGGVGDLIAIYHLLLRFYPREFRHEFGQEMAAVFAEQARSAAPGGGAALLRVCMSEYVGLPGAGMRERLYAWQSRSARLAATSGGPRVLATARWRPPRALFLLAIPVVLLGPLLAFRAWIASWDRQGTYHNTSEVADLNGDGRLDVIVVNFRTESESTSFSQITLWFNQDRGRFTPRVLEWTPYLYISAGSGDLDADGDADLVVLAATQLMRFQNQGGAQGGEAGEFKSFILVYPSEDPGTPGSVVLGDLDQDGRLDAFVAGCCGMALQTTSGREHYVPSHAWVWLNAPGARSYRDRSTLSLSGLGDLRMRDAALGDLDGDGSLDVFAALLRPKPGREGLSADLVLLNDGLGHLRDSGQRLGDGDSTAVTLGDVDGDGDSDALVGTGSGGLAWINQGGAQGGPTGVFAASGQALAGGPTTAVFLDDLDGDGDLDALIGEEQQAAVWWNDGQGAFTRSNQRFYYSGRHALAVADFDGDGRPDVFAGSYAEAYHVWLNQGGGVWRWR